jgi:hypothetical protein
MTTSVEGKQRARQASVKPLGKEQQTQAATWTWRVCVCWGGAQVFIG